MREQTDTKGTGIAIGILHDTKGEGKAKRLHRAAQLEDISMRFAYGVSAIERVEDAVKSLKEFLERQESDARKN